jgi:hypothetical protein
MEKVAAMIKRTAQRGRRWLLLVVPLALLAAACVPEGIRVPQSELSSLVERKAGLIAFLATDGNIYTIDQGGNGMAPVTADAFSDGTNYRLYGLPIWSPNSESLAFAGYEGASGENPNSISLVRVRVMTEYPLSSYAEVVPVISRIDSAITLVALIKSSTPHHSSG